MAVHATNNSSVQDAFINHNESSSSDDAGAPGGDQLFYLASTTEKKRLWFRNALISAGFIAAWFVFSTILSLYNKWMFSPQHFGFPFPLFVTTLHMLMQFLLAAVLRSAWPHHFRPDRRPTRADYGKKALPTGVITGLDIGLSNLSLKIISLSFYTMVKSSGLIFVLLFAFMFRLETFSIRLVGVILLIFCGVLLMVATQTKFVLSGLILVLSASALGGLRWSLTQLLLKNRKIGFDNPVATIFWLAPASGLSLAIISAAWDNWFDILGSRFFDGFDKTLRTCLLLLAPGIVAFAMVLSEFYILQRAGVVPMSIAGIAKEVSTITISAWVFGDELTPLNITGVAITVCGIALFTYHKYRKSVDALVPLDAHGNPIISDEDVIDSDEHGNTYHLQLSENSHPASDRYRLGDDEDDLGQDELSAEDAHELFNADMEGEEDADEFRSVRSSSKVR